MKQSGHLNPSEGTRTGFPVTSKYGRTPPNKHGGVCRQQQQRLWPNRFMRLTSSYSKHKCW